MSSLRDSVPIQGLSQWYMESGFPHRKPSLLQVVSEPYLTVARNLSLVDILGTFYTLYFIYIRLDYLKYTSPTLKNSIFSPLMQFLTWTS
jgi:hypothetical protein